MMGARQRVARVHLRQRIFVKWLRKDRSNEDSRQRDDDEVQPVPGVAQEREVGQDEASS